MTKVMERHFTLKEAEKIIDDFYFDNNISMEIKKYGSPLSSTIVALDMSLSPLKITEESENIGCGKGYDSEARVGAKFEAYEHYFTVQKLRELQSLFDSECVVNQYAFKNTMPLRILKTGKNRLISAIHFRGDEERGQPDLLFPSFLLNYRYAGSPASGDDTDYSSARRYSCGTGVAAGGNFEEAAIHAISEVAERDAVGRFLARHFFYQIPDTIVCVDPASLSDDVRNTLEEAQSMLRDTITLIDVTEMPGCAVYIACCNVNRIEGVNVFGAGASRYPEHALLRSIKELIQQYKVAERQEEVRIIWKRAYENSLENAHLKRCIALDFKDPENNARICSRPVRPPQQKISLPEQLRCLQKDLIAHDRPVWIKTLHSYRTGLHLVCAVMPVMERFSVAALGGRVVPCFKSDAY